MSVAVLHPQDCLQNPFSRSSLSPSNMKCPRNPNTNRPKRPHPNRRKRCGTRAKMNNSSPTRPSPTRTAEENTKFINKKNQRLVIGQVKILKRGEEIGRSTLDLVLDEPDLGYIRRIGPNPEKIHYADSKVLPTALYAGPVTLTSPPPGDLPLPAFFKKKTASVIGNVEATSNLMRLLRLDIS